MKAAGRVDEPGRATTPAARAIEHTQGREHTAVSDRAVSVREIPQTYLSGAQRECRSVVVALLHYSVETETLKVTREGFEAEQIDGSNRRDIKRRGQGDPYRNQAPEFAIVIQRAVESAFFGTLERGVLDQRGRGEQMAVEGERVEEGLEGGAGLTQRADTVDVRCAGKIAGAADIGKDFTG